MLFNWRRKGPQVFEVDPEGNLRKPVKKQMWIIVAVIIAVFVMAFGTGSDKSIKKTETASIDSKADLKNDYISMEEQRLENILKEIKGAGRVKALISVESYGEKVVGTNKKSENTKNTESQSSSLVSSEEKTAMYHGTEKGEEPFVVKEKCPMPCGVLIVAEGGGDESVRLEIYEAVKALYGISGHRIKVAAGSIA